MIFFFYDYSKKLVLIIIQSTKIIEKVHKENNFKIQRLIEELVNTQSNHNKKLRMKILNTQRFY